MKYLLLTFVFSLSSFSSEYCQRPFVRSLQNMAIKERTDFKKLLRRIHKKFNQVRDPSVAVKIFDEHYQVLKSAYHKEIEPKVANLREKKLPLEEFELAKRKIELNAIREYGRYFERLVREAYKILQDMGVPVRLTTVNRDGLNYKAIVIDAEKAKNNSHAVKKLNRYNKRFNTNVVTIDLYETIEKGAEAFFDQIAKRVELGSEGVRGLAIDDIIMMTPKHEFHHAAFAAKRDKGVGSLYHTKFLATGEKNLSSVENGYNRFMSAEELYNFANNSFWGSEKLINPSMFTSVEIYNDVVKIANFLVGTEKVARQAVELTSNLKKGYVKMLDDLKANEFKLGIVDSSGNQASSIQEAQSLIFMDKSNEVQVLEFIDPEIRGSVEALMKKRFDVELRYSSRFGADANEEEKAKALAELIADENKVNRDHHKKIIEFMQKRNITLEKVAKALAEESVVTAQKTTTFLERMKKLYEETGENFELNPSDLRDLVEEYRRLGNLVKEDYKGFAGR